MLKEIKMQGIFPGLHGFKASLELMCTLPTQTSHVLSVHSAPPPLPASPSTGLGSSPGGLTHAFIPERLCDICHPAWITMSQRL